MAYLEQLQAGLRYLGRAGESGRKSLDKVVAPVNGAISEIRAQPRSWRTCPAYRRKWLPAAACHARHRPGAGQGEPRGSTYDRASRALLGIDERLDALKVQVNSAAQAVGKVAGDISPTLAGCCRRGCWHPRRRPRARPQRPCRTCWYCSR